MKNLLKVLVAIILIVIQPTIVTQGYAQELESMEAIIVEPEIAIEADLTVPEDTPASEDAPAEEIAPEEMFGANDTETIMNLLAPDRSIRISAEWDGDRLGVGDKVRLRAVVSGYEKVEYELAWQWSADGAVWTSAGAQGETFTYKLSAENYSWMWRVVVIVHAPLSN